MLFNDASSGIRISAILRIDGRLAEELGQTDLLGQLGSICVVPVNEEQQLTIEYRISGPQQLTIADLKLDGRFRFGRKHGGDQAIIYDDSEGVREIRRRFDRCWSRKGTGLCVSQMGIGPDDIRATSSTARFSSQVGVIELNFWITHLPEHFRNHKTWDQQLGGFRRGESFEDDLLGPASALEDDNSARYPAYKFAGLATNRIVPLWPLDLSPKEALSARQARQEPLPYRGGLVTFKFLYRDATILKDRLKTQSLLQPNPVLGSLIPAPTAPASPKRLYLAPPPNVLGPKPSKNGSFKPAFPGLVQPIALPPIQSQSSDTTAVNTRLPDTIPPGRPTPVDPRKPKPLPVIEQIVDRSAMIELTTEQFIRRLTLIDDGKSQTAHVACRYFKYGKCQAGNACPFSHAPDVVFDPAPCEWFAKGTCKFGSNCANPHLLPEVPIPNTPASPARESPGSTTFVKAEPISDDEIEFVSERILRRPARDTQDKLPSTAKDAQSSSISKGRQPSEDGECVESEADRSPDGRRVRGSPSRRSSHRHRHRDEEDEDRYRSKRRRHSDGYDRRHEDHARRERRDSPRRHRRRSHSRSRSRSRSREKEGIDRYVPRSSSRRDDYLDRVRERDRDGERKGERREREKRERERDRDRDRHRDKDRDRDRAKEREREDRDRDRERDHARKIRSTCGSDAVPRRSTASPTSWIERREVERKRRFEKLTMTLHEVKKELAELDEHDTPMRVEVEDDADDDRRKRIKAEHQ